MVHASSLFVLAASLCVVTVVASTIIGATSSSSSSPITPNPKPSNGFVTQVHDLPGYGPKEPPVPMYNGMLSIDKAAPNKDTKMYMKYTFFGSQAGTGEEVPLLVFQNGGPGAPSSYSAFVETGPLLLNEQSYLTESYQRTGLPSPVDNPHAWTNFAMMIFLDDPPPSGFSYCDPPGPAGNGAACGTWNDTRVGVSIAETLRLFVADHFPNLFPAGGTKRKLFIVSESYGGVYLAAALEEIMKKPEYSTLSSRLAGVGFGDTCMGSEMICGNPLEGRPWWHLLFMYGHGQLSNEIWNKLLTTCGEPTLKYQDPKDYDAVCSAAYQEAVLGIGKWYTYNLYDNCPNPMFDASLPSSASSSSLHRHQHQHQHQHHHHEAARRRHRHQSNKRLRDWISSSRGETHDDATTMLLNHLKNKKLIEKEEQERRAQQQQQKPPKKPVSLQRRVPSFFGDEEGGSSSFSNNNNNNNNKAVMNGYWCAGDVIIEYMSNFSSVKAAFGVPLSDDYFIQDDARGMPYNFTLQNAFSILRAILVDTHEILPRPADAPKIKVLSYNADADPAVNMFFTQDVWYQFAKNTSLGRTKEWQDWWLYGTSVAGGHTVEWGGGQLQYRTALGAGHMVPEYRPRIAAKLAYDFMFEEIGDSSKQHH